jgi:hypothetical protein
MVIESAASATVNRRSAACGDRASLGRLHSDRPNRLPAVVHRCAHRRGGPTPRERRSHRMTASAGDVSLDDLRTEQDTRRLTRRRSPLTRNGPDCGGPQRTRSGLCCRSREPFGNRLRPRTLRVRSAVLVDPVQHAVEVGRPGPVCARGTGPSLERGTSRAIPSGVRRCETNSMRRAGRCRTLASRRSVTHVDRRVGCPAAGRPPRCTGISTGPPRHLHAS